jgi:hypothetical protein
LQNFYPGATTVSIGGLPCTSPVVTDVANFGVVRCIAPSGPGFGDVRLEVAVASGGNTSVPFLYAAPEVTGLSVTVCPADVNFVIQVMGTNIGLRNSVNSPDPVVYIGNTRCFQPVLPSLTDVPTVQCTALASPVGAYPVVGT